MARAIGLEQDAVVPGAWPGALHMAMPHVPACLHRHMAWHGPSLSMWQQGNALCEWGWCLPRLLPSL